MTTPTHERVTDDAELNARLIEEYETTDDTGEAFTAHVLALGLNPPERVDVIRWGFAIVGEPDGSEHLVWDAEAVLPPTDTAGA